MDSAASSAPRCAAHGLVAGPDGQCVICRRREAPPAGAGNRVVFAALGLLSALCVGGVIYKQVAARAATAAAVTPEAQAAVEGAGQDDGELDQGPLPLRAPQRRGWGAPQADSKRPGAAARGTAPGVAKAAGAPATPADRDRAGQEDRDRRDALAAEMRRVEIVMYTTQWCPHCQEARAWMFARGVSFTERDVEADPEAKKVQRVLNPGGGVPTIDIDGAVLVGFSAGQVERALRRAAERRLAR
jgi:glutaredoxin 3